MPDLFDSHCHIQSAGQDRGEAATVERWQKLGIDRQEIWRLAKEAGVNQLLLVGCDLEDSALAAEFAASDNGLYTAVGIHPHAAKSYVGDKELKSRLTALVKQSAVVAIGESGLDYYYSHSAAADQQAVLIAQLEVAKACRLPVVFHVREAFDDFWPIYDRFKLAGVLHSFSDDQTTLAAALKRGLYIGVNGIATFSKQPEVYKQIPLARLMLETDAPFLTPAVDRNRTNQPAYLSEVAQFLAGLRGESLEGLASHTTANARKLFKI